MYIIIKVSECNTNEIIQEELIMKNSWKKFAVSSGIALLLSGALAPSLIVKADTTEQISYRFTR